MAALFGISAARAATTVQVPGNTIGSGDAAWSYLIVEGESYETKSNEDPLAGFARVDNTDTVKSFLDNPVLGSDTTASGNGALSTQTTFGQHIDKVTYSVQFSTPGTYYLYMRFTMFENGGNVDHYLNEDSFFVPPDFDKDPQTDWPLSDRGGYAEGCCDSAGYLHIQDGDVRVSRSGGGEEGQAYWEGNFHWNLLQSSQFLNPETQGEPSAHFKYEVTAEMVGKPMTWTVSYREGGTTIDLFLFSTSTNLMTEYKQEDLDLVLLGIEGDVTIQDPGNVVGTGADAWSYLILEGEDYDLKSGEAPEAGFARVDDTDAVMSFLGNPVLGSNTTASAKGALWTQTTFGQHIDKVTYNVRFARAGTYYLYMRFTMYENGGNVDHYLNEDSFFVPPDFGKDPKTDWPLSDRGGYAEGCCDSAGYLHIQDGDVRVSRSGGGEGGQAYWEGNFHWNLLQSSQFLNAETQGEPSAHFKYEVTGAMVGQPLTWMVSYREGGTTIDLFLFSTNPDLMTEHTQEELDALFINPVAAPSLAIARTGARLALSWPTAATGYVLESTGALPAPTWTAVADAIVVSGDRNTVAVDAAPGARYYRLKKP